MAPAKGKKGKSGKPKKIKTRAPDPTLDCILPREIMSNILARVPVKDLLRFRCVCKPWRKLFSKPHFINTHFHYSSPSILISTRDADSSDHVLSLYKTGQGVEELDNPYPVFFPNMFMVGPCNGIVCLFQPSCADAITLWNPAMRQSRLVPLSDNKRVPNCWMVSLGMAFDPNETDNLFILRIFCETCTWLPSQLEICSAKSNFTWKKIKNEMLFSTFSYTSNATFKGVPYWWAHFTKQLSGMGSRLVRFDLGKEVFESVPLPVEARGQSRLDLMILGDSLSMLTWQNERKEYLDVWVMDDEDCWSKKCKVGPLFGFDKSVRCLRNGDIVAENEKGELVLFDPVTASVKAKFSVNNTKNDSYKCGSYIILDYAESLLLIPGMLPVKKQNPRDRNNFIRYLRKYLTN